MVIRRKLISRFMDYVRGVGRSRPQEVDNKQISSPMSNDVRTSASCPVCVRNNQRKTVASCDSSMISKTAGQEHVAQIYTKR